VPILRLLNSTTFRLALIYMIFFAASVFGLLVVVYWSTTGFMERQTDATVGAEIRGLEEQYNTDGVGRLIEVIQRRSRRAGDSLYMLAHADGERITGNLNSWPDGEADKDGWLEFTFERPTEDGPREHEARARVFEVQGTFRLLVGRDIEARRQIERTIRTTLGWAMAVTAALGLIGGALLARYMMGRLDEVNRTARGIIEGDLTHRVPVRGSGDEIDQLAENLNAMLSQIERLMMGMRQVTDNIAHDLRSPLNRLRNRIEVTLIEQEGEEAYEAALRQTIDDADDLISTFNALLSIAQIEAGALRDEMSNVDVGAIAADVVELYEPASEEAEVTMSAEIGEGLVVRGNRELISQSLANLIDNAIKYAGKGGTVHVTAEAVGTEILLCVSDTGPGIPAEDRERVTERFVRLEDSRSAPGAGLGLSLVAAVAKLHDGRIALTGNEEGPGLRACLYLPRA
jgi:signal transduction histidine kinase